MKTTFFLGRETLILVPGKNMRTWRKTLFAYLSRNAWDASKFFRIPPNRVIEIGIQVEL
jgi:KUP system potassium uptake protein